MVAKNKPTSTTYWDDQVKGLHLRRGITKESYYLFYRTRSGIQRRPKLGDSPAISLPEARRRAQAILSRVAIGEDPSGEWKVSKREITIDILFDRVWQRHWDTPRFRDSGWRDEVLRTYERNVEGPFSTKRISEISAIEVRRWHESMIHKPIDANRSLEILSRLFRFAEENELCDSNPCRFVRSFTESQRSRYASPQEIKAIAERLMAYRGTLPRETGFIFLLMVTGARPKSLAKVRRRDLTVFEGYGLLVFHGKSTAATGRKEEVVIPDWAMREVVSKLPVRSDGLLIGGPVPARFWRKVREEVGCDDLWLRDFRRLFATVGMGAGYANSIVGRLLNHSSTQTTERYANLVRETRVTVTQAISDKIVGMF